MKTHKLFQLPFPGLMRVSRDLLSAFSELFGDHLMLCIQSLAKIV